MRLTSFLLTAVAGLISTQTLDLWANSTTIVKSIPKPIFDKKDFSRKRIQITLRPIVSGFNQPTDLQFLPEDPNILFVLEKEGALKWFSLKNGNSGTVLELEVQTDGEMGLLGMTFHPQFATNRLIYLNYNPKPATPDAPMRTRISEWILPAKSDPSSLSAEKERVILEVEQPYANHKAGQLAFGPDGYLYVGLGDGGKLSDPHENGQNKKSLLGKILRLDVNHPVEPVISTDPNSPSIPGKPYSIPKDNPFAEKKEYAPEIWALGFRNPWRYAFDSRTGAAGHLIVADIGEAKWEELSLVQKGKNYGWNVTEGTHCFKPQYGCKKGALTEPFFEYGREEGGTIIGGQFYTGTKISGLTNKYVFGDFLSGRIWAIDLPLKTTLAKVQKVYALGRWPLHIVTFGKDPSGELYVADFMSGTIYRLEEDPFSKTAQ